ncbi:hypothetical protein [Neptuniibacter halophilus]|uniref:hypothetical protein n=1 Tax=Neptuniibacter halophilus TaxID=651666 RepID=UPI0025733AAE|nr:hypothetical protein [Neptuniibacter halophilus]
MATMTVRQLEASSSASSGAISYIELARVSACVAFYGSIALVMCKLAKRIAEKTLKAVKEVPEDEIIDPSGELTEALEKIAVTTYELCSPERANKRNGFFSSRLNKELIALNHLHNDTLVWINEHNADAAGLSEGGPYETADDFINSLV